MIENRRDLKEYLKVEKQKYNLKMYPLLSGIREDDILWKHQKLLRKTEYYHNAQRRIMFVVEKIRLLRIQNKYALHIPINTCEKGLHVMHVGSILINEKAVIGENCALHINTGIVAGGVDGSVPKLGKNIVVGIGAVILGGIQLADSIAVGANAVVNKSFNEENIAIAGVPAKKISNNGRTHWNAGSNEDSSKECGEQDD